MSFLRKIRSIPLLNGQRTFATKVRRKTNKEIKNDHEQLFPSKLLTRKQKTPNHFYLANESIANIIDKHLHKHFQQTTCDTILEINPGVGFFTRKLLDREETFKKIILIESMEHFLPNLEELHVQYPDRVKVQHGDFINISKLVFMDRTDNGLRVEELLRHVPKKSLDDKEPNMILFGAVGSYDFFKNMIRAFVFQNSFCSYGRTEMFLIVPPAIYLHLTCNNSIGYMIYRSKTILFQLLFEHQFIACLPREDFLPTQSAYNHNGRHVKLNKICSVNPDDLYLVRIIPRNNIYELCSADNLPTLWYFIKHNCMRRSDYVIPTLEKWIPGCGVRLIMNNKPSEKVEYMYPNENIMDIPLHSTRCVHISDQDYFQDMNIYTQFGDLTPANLLRVYLDFSQWPEFRDSAFLAAFDNTILKLHESSDDGNFNPMEELNDVEHDIDENGLILKKSKKRKKPTE